eukprot:855846-Amphidinium_carterae.1
MADLGRLAFGRPSCGVSFCIHVSYPSQKSYTMVFMALRSYSISEEEKHAKESYTKDFFSQTREFQRCKKCSKSQET